MGENRTQINIRVTPEQKENWEEYVGENGRFSTLTGLIRAGVASEINRSDDSPSPILKGMENDIEQLQDSVEEIRKDVAYLREQQQDEVDVSDIAQEVYEELEVLPEPNQPVPDGIDKEYSAALLVINPDEDESYSPQTASDIAERVGIQEGRFFDAIEYLDEQFLPVVQVEVNGETHFFKSD